MNDTVNPRRAQGNCGKCGLCLSACPVYKILKEEQASPRARIQLIQAYDNETLLSSPRLKEIISTCLMCGSCAKACPSGVNHYEKFMEMRRKMVEALGDPPAIKALVHLLSKEFMLRTGTGMAALGQRITPSALAEKYRVGNIPLSRLPRLNRTPFRKSFSGLIPQDPGVTPRGRVAYFTGCATNFMFEDTGKATVKVLTRLGYEVLIPETQVCCAIPMLFHGAQAKAAASIRTNILALSDTPCDRIIVDCSTCGAALKDEYPAFLANARDGQRYGLREGELGTLADRADEVSGKVTDILSFLAETNGVQDPAVPKKKGGVRAVYHAPCHSRNSFDSLEKVRQLLAALPGIDYVPLANEADCCGGGGTFFYEHPDLAQRMMERKLAAVRAEKPSLWLTDCPVCRINLAGSLDASDRIEICHPVVLAARALDTRRP